MRRDLLTFVTTMLALGIALPASAQMMGGTGGGMMQGGGGMSHMMMSQPRSPMRGEHMDMARPHEGPQVSIMLQHSQELGLNPEQVRKLQELRTGFAKDSVRKAAEVHVAEIDLNALLEQDHWDLGRIETTVKQIATLQADLRLARLKTIQAARALLNAEQLEKLKQVGHRMGPGAGGGPMRQGMGMPGMGQPGAATPGPGTPGSGTHQQH
jgi:Spy/CpxP family protein refolding chaperone